MQKTKKHNNGDQPLIKAIKSTLVLLVLFVYCVIPFKQQFLDTVHLLSHISVYENPLHSHDHGDAEAGHHHEHIAF